MFFSYLGMGKLFVLRCILNPAKKLHRPEKTNPYLQQRNCTFEDKSFFPFRVLDIFCFIEG